ncbi:MAG TPA: ribonuclease P protein component [Thermoanaerobaculia bacterium]|nr:ribonuclease P protein component [Thermoanaerobaculia bacterium]
MTSGPDRRRETFSRDDRLRKRREFEECYASGVRVSGRHLQVFLLPTGAGDLPPGSDSTPHPRLGLSVPRRVGAAVIRNRVRRRLREIFRRNRDLFASRSADVVINAKPSAGEAPFAELLEEYRSLIEKTLPRARAKRKSRPR